MRPGRMLMIVAWLAAPGGALAQALPPVMPLPKTAPPPAAGATKPAPIYLVEQLVVPGQLPQPVKDKLPPLKTLQQVEDLLKVNNLSFGWTRGQLNTAVLDPRLVQQIDGLPPGEIIVMQDKDRVFIMVITGRR